jgi:cell division protein ZapA (FtsZ GTPase activity inhibitor)
MANISDLKKVIIFNQEYKIKSTAKDDYIQEIANLVNNKMVEVKKSGLANENQQLRIAILAAMNIADEFLQADKSKKALDKIHAKTLAITDYIDEKIENLENS